MSRHERRRRSGFTLFELMAAVALSGLVVAGGAELFDQINDAGARIANAALTASRMGNGRQQLRALLTGAEPSLDTADRFRGDSMSARYVTRCPTSFGWAERCHARLFIDQRDDSSDVVARLNDGPDVTLVTRRGRAQFRYLDLERETPLWAAEWLASATLPNAIAIVANGDTVVAPLGVSRDD